MKKRLTALLTAVLLVFAMAMPAQAAKKKTKTTAKTTSTTETTETTTAPEETTTTTAAQATASEFHHVLDPDSMLSSKTKKQLEKAAEAVYEKNGIELFCYLTDKQLDDLNATGLEIYNFSSRNDTAMVMLYDAKKVGLHAYGRAAYILSDEELQHVVELSNAEESYLKAYMAFIKETGSLLDEKGTLPIPSERQKPRFVDEADLVSADDEANLLEKLNEISERHQLDVVIVTENGIGDRTPNTFAEDFFQYNGFGYGDHTDGIILLISMENRDWAIATHGLGIDVFTDAGQEYMTDAFVSYLSDGDYYGGFNRFAELCDEFLVHYEETGAAYDVGSLPKDPFDWGGAFLGALLVGALVGLITVLTLRSQLKSVRVQESAVGYSKPGSLQLTEKNDVFLYHVVNRTARPRDTDSSSGHSSGGGSSTHHSSSSGSSFGGSHGHF